MDLIARFGRLGTMGNEGLDLVKLGSASGFEPWRIVEIEYQEGGGGSGDFALWTTGQDWRSEMLDVESHSLPPNRYTVYVE